MSRATRAQLRDAFARYQQAYAAAGLGTTQTWWADDAAEHTYRTTALDLVLQEPDEFRAGRVEVTPWLNPVAPQRHPGASGSSTPAGVEYLGETVGECLRTLRAATATLYAITGAESHSDRATPRRRLRTAAERAYIDGLTR